MNAHAMRAFRAYSFRPDLQALPAVLLGVWLAKRFYAQANVDDLAFILYPTVRLVEFALQSPFPFEAGVGYVSQAHATAIVPACAGLNFMLAIVLTLSLGLSHRFVGTRKPLFLVGTWLLAYLCTLLTNALRITLDVTLRGAMESAHASLHRALGTLLCFLVVCLVYAWADHRFPGAAA